MTVSSGNNQVTGVGNGVTTVFNYNFPAVSSNDIQVTFTDTDGSQTLLNPSSYTLFMNPISPGQLWSIGGTVTYNPSGSPIADGTTLLIERLLPLTQETTIRNQGPFYESVVEEALDTLCYEIQQVSGRTGKIRGTWVTGIQYNYADIVQDGANGADTLNYYMCQNANLSTTWAADLAAGDWVLAINIQQAEQFATDAATSAAMAAVSATSSASSATASAASAASASTQATASANSASAAATSATTATGQAAVATTQAGIATTQAGNALSSASAASTSASSASTSANNASTSATAASTSASQASTSATNAATSASAAAASASQAAGSLLGTSATSNTIGLGDKTFTTQAGLSLGIGGFVTIAETSTPANYFHGQVKTYSGTTLVVTVLDDGGSGAHSDWTITTSSPQGPGGSGAGTVNSGTTNQLTYYAGTGTTVSGDVNATVSAGALTLGQAASVQGSLILSGSVGSATTLAAPTTGTGTMTLQAGTDTVVARATTDTLTNKTLTSSTNTLGGVTTTVGSDATGDIYYRNSGGIRTRLAIGTANQVLHGGTTPSYSAVVEGDITLADVTTNNVTSTKHGLAPKSPGNSAQFLSGAATPAYASVTDANLSVSDVTTNNVTSTAHGFTPKSPSNAAQFLNGAATPAFASVTDANLSVSDVTTNNVSISAHGFAPKAPNDATKYLDGTGAYSTPAGASGSMVLLGSATASASATLPLLSMISATYPAYLLVIKDIKISAATPLLLRTSINNSTFDTTGGHYATTTISYAAAGSPVTASGIVTTGVCLTLNSGTNLYYTGQIRFSVSQVAGGVNNPSFFAEGSYNGAPITSFGLNTSQTSPLNAIELAVASGTMASGTIYLYGIKTT